MTAEHELHGFFRSFSRKLAEDYAATRPRVLEDPGTSGDQGEESWAQLLRAWLPEGYTVVTKGRILGASGEASQQVDVIILKPSYPKFLKNEKYFFLDGVAAAFECKLTLRSGHLEKAMNNAKIIAGLKPKQKGSPQKELMSPIVYGVLAHSHAWESSNDTTVSNLTDKIHKLGQQAKEPRELPELVCIADLSGWRLSHCVYTHHIIGQWMTPDANLRRIVAHQLKDELGSFATKMHETETAIQLWANRPHSQYTVQYYPEHVCSTNPTDVWTRFTPVGAFIAALYDKLAYRDPSLLNISSYFKAVHVPASTGGGVNSANGELKWSPEILSDSIWNSPWEKGPEWQEIFF